MREKQTRKQENASKHPPNHLASLLTNVTTILSNVEKSDLMKSHEQREYPMLDPSEVETGRILGRGGFGIVSEVAAIRAPQTTPEINDGDDNCDKAAGIFQESLMSDDNHYKLATAKEIIAGKVHRGGKARYAIKKLDPSLSDLDRTRGMIDMALEVKYLTVLWHPNIVKMRGVCSGDMMQPNFFFVMDRLYDTLETRIKTWNKQKRGVSGIFGIGKDKAAKRKLLVERLVVAYDLAMAFSYMHDNSLVYRDIKQENIGFDIRGDVKVFDFGLAKALHPSLKAKKSKTMYNLTPITGSVPYMAPEVAMSLPYNCRCDCFSFALLFHEILALRNSHCHSYPPQEYFQRVIIGNERPPIRRTWPERSKKVIDQAWNYDPQQRPSMQTIAKDIRGDMDILSQQDDVINRTRHMLDRSILSKG